MISPNNDDRRAPITPQLAMRVAILGGVALALFAIVFFRLWFLQVLSGDKYLAQAAGNRTRTVAVQAPRGDITDRNGNVLVGNHLGVSVVISPPRLPKSPARRHAELVRLSHVLNLSTKPEGCRSGAGDQRNTQPRMTLECRIDIQIYQLPYADVIARSDVSRPVFGYLDERASQFPGVSTEQSYLRSYPDGEAGAQLWGTIAQVSAPELKQKRFRGVQQGSLVGQSGLEYTYDQYLRGTNGEQRIQVDANGRAVGSEPTIKPRPGYDLRLSLDAGVEREGQAALQTGTDLANQNGNPGGAGAFVAMDPRNGQIIGMGSTPSFSPADAERRLTPEQYRQFVGSDGNQVNRAIGGLYPVGSTFKVVTASAAMAAGVVTPNTVYNDVGVWRDGLQSRQNSGHAVYGETTLESAFKFSVDTYFYQLGQDLNVPPEGHPNGGALQRWARMFGFGKPTGIDLPSESAGVVPDPAWRDHANHEQAQCVAEETRAQRDPHYRSQYRGLCAYADGTNRQWSEGDNVSLAVGQGDFLATPLQMATAYSAIENGGKIYQPHVGEQVTTADGGIVSTVPNKLVRRLNIPNLDAIQTGLSEAAESPGGTSYDVWRGFPSQYQVHGKTGTAQHTGQPDQAWYVCYIPDPVRPIVIAVTIERGGFGAQSAAPVARLIASQWFGVRKVVQAGSSGDL